MRSDEIDELKKIFFEFFAREIQTPNVASHLKHQYYDLSENNGLVFSEDVEEQYGINIESHNTS
jgi:hypothetical protein